MCAEPTAPTFSYIAFAHFVGRGRVDFAAHRCCDHPNDTVTRAANLLRSCWLPHQMQAGRQHQHERTPYHNIDPNSFTLLARWCPIAVHRLRVPNYCAPATRIEATASGAAVWPEHAISRRICCGKDLMLYKGQWAEQARLLPVLSEQKRPATPLRLIGGSRRQ